MDECGSASIVYEKAVILREISNFFINKQQIFINSNYFPVNTMDAAYITLPIFMALIVGSATHLESVAEDTSAKALAFTDDMNDAMDCATRGIPISACSPNLTNHDFSEEQEEFLAILDEMKETFNNTIIVDNETGEPLTEPIII